MTPGEGHCPEFWTGRPVPAEPRAGRPAIDVQTWLSRNGPGRDRCAPSPRNAASVLRPRAATQSAGGVLRESGQVGQSPDRWFDMVVSFGFDWRGTLRQRALGVGCAACVAAASHGGFWANAVVEYEAGADAAFGYTDPSAALGQAARTTGASFGFPSVVSPFSPPFETDQVVSIGRGGSLTLRMGRRVRDAAHHAFGVDFIVFGNAGFIDTSFPAGQVGNQPAMFGVGPTVFVEASQDGSVWHAVQARRLDLMPTLGYLDAGPFDQLPGSIESNFRKAMDPGLTLSDLTGLDYAGLLALYGQSGGGVGFDLAGTGLSFARFLRFSHAGDAIEPFEIDAVSVVPAPGSLGAAVLGLLFVARRRN